MLNVVEIKQLIHVAETQPYPASPKAHTQIVERGHFRYRLVLRKGTEGTFYVTLSKTLLANREQVPLRAREVERLLRPLTAELSGRLEPFDPPFSLNEHSRHFRNVVR